MERKLRRPSYESYTDARQRDAFEYRMREFRKQNPPYEFRDVVQDPSWSVRPSYKSYDTDQYARQRDPFEYRIREVPKQNPPYEFRDRRYTEKVEGLQKIKDEAAYGPWGGTVGFSILDGTYTKVPPKVGGVQNIRDVEAFRPGERTGWFPLDEKVPPKVGGVQKIKDVAAYGPWGGTGGFSFDDGTYTSIRQINLSHNEGIKSIKVCYDRDGIAVWGSTHGDSGGFKFDRVIFDYPSEILTCITGTYGVVKYTNVIKSITFHTNKGKHGPFGEEKGSSFTSNAKAGKKIVGFHGREGLFLDAIGVHVVDMDIPEWPNKVEPTPTEHEELNKLMDSRLHFRSMTHLAYH
ncbi:hypothetical protein Dsin_003570 [Dipteronia sinensis]|uniref:Jacalin-type lectin domain-containing protein n=1 Tax=Dipteronia sinensis TaxID=43782 RepID=A0AAE0B968_9ROSI|nr:hypothetical protein Dsin_003570 [Dipteronia sinensis]